MDLIGAKNELSIKCKNGIGFLLSGMIIWLIITCIFLTPMRIDVKNMFALFSTGIMFPLALAFSSMIKAEWKLNGQLGSLGMYLNLAQLIYFPILFWAFMKSPQDMIVFFSIITGAHLFPYGWFYNAKPYYFMAPIIAVMIMVIGWSEGTPNLWLIPLSMVFLLFILILWLRLDYKKKYISSNNSSHKLWA